MHETRTLKCLMLQRRTYQNQQKSQRDDFLWDGKIDFPSRERKTTKWKTAGW